MRLAALAILLLLAAPRPVKAGPAEVAAALPNEQAECRYLLSICARVDKASGTGGLEAMIDAGKAAQVIRAKHDQMPACFRKCTGDDGKPILNLERFR